MKPVIKFEQLLELANARKSICYYYIIRHNKHCFCGNIKQDVANANKIITSIKVNNTGHVTAAAFNWAFNHFYGQKFNSKYLASRSQEISKFTTRLSQDDITYIRTKFIEWIEEGDKVCVNRLEAAKISRKRIYFAFEALLASGMRVASYVP